MNRLQQAFKDYQKAGYWGEYTAFENIRHMHAHLSKLIGLIGEYVEEREHFGKCESSIDEIKEMVGHLDNLKRKTAADLIIFGLGFAEVFKQDINEIFDKRMERNRQVKCKKIFEQTLDKLPVK